MRIAYRDLPVWLEQRATVVTPTPFLAGAAREQFARERLKQNLETWERPAIYGLDAWLVSCWQDARYTLPDVPTLLSSSQERALWHLIIEQEHPHLFDVSSTVRLARDAAGVLAEWHIPSEGELWAEHSDALQFQRWLRLFRHQCRENHWTTRSELKRLLAGWIAAGKWRPPLTAFVGFPRVSPALDKVLDSMGPLSVRLPFDSPKPAKKAAAKEFDSFPDEVDFAARRLRFLFEEQPERSLALFVPGLAEHTRLVERTLHEVFFPSVAANLERAKSAEALFRISSTGLLRDEPLVSSALLLLNLGQPQIDHADAGAILRCPFIKGAREERNQRALADIKLRQRRELDAAFRDLERVSQHCPLLIDCWQKLTKLLPKISQRRTFTGWSELISDILIALGWPGDSELTSREERIVEQWKAMLSELSSLGLVSGPVSFAAAMAQLRRLLSRPNERGEWESPIQVLDTDQAAGLSFDASVLVSISEETWPPPVRVSPLIPFRLLRHHNVPGATAQGVREERARKTQALFDSAPNVAVTFTRDLSSAAASFVSKKSKSSFWEGCSPWASFEAAALEQFADGMAPPFVSQGEAKGGTGIIKAQSLCPFQAFAKYRLHARKPEDASFGFDALDRGSFVHKSLELVWRRLESFATLKQMPREHLEQLVREAITEAVKSNDSGPLHQLNVETERERLQEVLLDWLAVEQERQLDFTVDMIEEKRTFEVPGLSLQLRVDRVDRLKNGNLVLIDYKSGQQSRPKLEGERPAEPQLLVYAAAAGSRVDGIFFGQLKPREVKAVGFSRTRLFKGQTATVKDKWDEYVETSRATVEKLATEFVQGVAEVRPTHAPCEFCGMKPFCRVNEQGTMAEEEE